MGFGFWFSSQVAGSLVSWDDFVYVAPRTPNFAAKKTGQQFIVVSAGAHATRVKWFRFYLKKNDVNISTFVP